MAALIITDEVLIQRLQTLGEEQGETVERYLAIHFGSRNSDDAEDETDPLLVLTATARQRGFRTSRDDIAENFERVLHCSEHQTR